MRNSVLVFTLAVASTGFCGTAAAQADPIMEHFAREQAQAASRDFYAEYDANRAAEAERLSRPTYEQAWMPAFTAIATWTDPQGREQFVTALSPESAEQARAQALTDCAAGAAGRTCGVSFMIQGGWFGVARAEDGRVLATRARNENLAGRDAIRDCRRAYGGTCAVEYVGRSDHYGTREVNQLPARVLDAVTLGAQLGILTRRR